MDLWMVQKAQQKTLNENQTRGHSIALMSGILHSGLNIGPVDLIFQLFADQITLDVRKILNL